MTTTDDITEEANNLIDDVGKQEPILKWGDGKSYPEIRRLFAMLYNKNSEPFIPDGFEDPVPSAKPLKWYVKLALNVLGSESLKVAYDDFRLASKLTEIAVPQYKRINTVVSDNKRNHVTEFKTELDRLMDKQEGRAINSLIMPALLKAISFKKIKR